MRIKLFGGPENGRELEVQDFKTEISLAVLDPMPVEWLKDPEALSMVAYEKITYTRKLLRGDLKSFFIWAPKEWTADDIIEELLKPWA